MKKILGLSTLVLVGALAFSGCSISDEDGKAWAEENGYVKSEAEDSQTELFSEFKKITENSIAKPYWQAKHELKTSSDKTVINSYATVDDNGFYYISDSGDGFYLAKVEDKYVFCSSVSDSHFCSYINAQKYNEEIEHYDFSFVLNGSYVFNADSIEEMIENVKENLLIKQNAKFPLKTDVNFSKDSEKNTLMLKMFMDCDAVQYEITVVCQNELIDSFKVIELSPTKNSISHYTIDYSTNQDIVKTDFELPNE